MNGRLKILFTRMIDVKNFSIRGLMGLYHIYLVGYHICPEGYYLYSWIICILGMTNKQMAPLIYVCFLCSYVLFLRIKKGRRDLYTTSTHIRLFIGIENEKTDLAVHG